MSRIGKNSKILQRFIAGITAFIFAISDLFFPVSVSAFVPGPVVPLVKAAAPQGLKLVLSSQFLLPIVVGGLAVGAAYYFWSESQTEQASELAKDKYCALYPQASVCIPPSNYSVKFSYASYYSPGQTFYRVVSVVGAPAFSAVDVDGSTFRIYDSSNQSVGYHSGSNATIIAWCPVTPFGDGFASGTPQDSSTACSSTDPTAWKNWPDSERSTATNLLTNEDLTPILQSNPGGNLESGQQLNDGAWVAPNETSDFQFVPGPVTISAPPDFDGDGQPDSTDSDDDNDSTPDLSDPDPKNPNIPAPAPNPSPSPTPNPTPTTSPPPPDPDAPPSPPADPAPPGPVTFTPVQPATFNGVNFVSYGIQKFSDKFPFDIFGNLPTDAPNACPTFSFFGQSKELCIIKDFLSALKWPVIIGFLVWGVLFI